MYISVVTICRNIAYEIDITIHSISTQTNKEFEWIIVDGNSTDGTLEKLKEVDFKYKKIISEPDNGIYDAMNKGIELAQGQFIIFINGGDALYCPETINKLTDKINAYSFDIGYGDTQYQYTNFSKVKKCKELQNIYFALPTSHQSFIIKKELLLKKKFDTQFKICADFDQILTFYIEKKTFLNLDFIISQCDTKGISNHKPCDAIKEVKQISLKKQPSLWHFIIFIKMQFVCMLKQIIKKKLPMSLVTYVQQSK